MTTSPTAPGKTCSVYGCGGRRIARGLCNLHWKRLRNMGPLPPITRSSGCSVGGCGGAHHAHGLCAMHAARKRRSENPEKCSQQARASYWRNRDAALARNARWRTQNAEKIAAYNERYRDRRREIDRIWSANNKPQRLRAARKWRAKHGAEWRQKNRTTIRERQRRSERRAAAELRDSYLKGLLGIGRTLPALFEAKRVQLQILRLARKKT